MPTIVTITFSPCIDKSTTVANLVPEKKLRCAAPKMEPGGGGINVARAIKKLGGEATAIFPSGGYTGNFFNQLLDLEKIPSIIIETVNPTKENIIILDESNNNQYRFGMPGTALSETEWKHCLKAVEEVEEVAYIVASGSLPPGVPLDIFAQIAKIAKDKNAKFIVDTSGEALQQAVNEGVYLIKPNLGELASLVGKTDLQLAEVKDAAQQVIAKGKCEIMVVSLGADGAMLVTKDNVHTATPPPVDRKSTVGAGDSMVAGIVLSLSQGKTLAEALQYGVACGTAATMNDGTGLCKPKDVEQIFTIIQENSIL